MNIPVHDTILMVVAFYAWSYAIFSHVMKILWKLGISCSRASYLITPSQVRLKSETTGLIGFDTNYCTPPSA